MRTRSSLVAAFLFVLLALALRGADHAGAPIRCWNVAANAGLRFALENNPTPRKYLRNHARGSSGLRLRRRRTDRHLLRQRGVFAVSGKDFAQILEPPLPEPV